MSQVYMTTNEEMIAITVDEYVDLIRTDLTLDTLLDVLIGDAELEWDDKSLKFNQKDVNHVLRALCRNKYYSKLTFLQKERKEKLDGLNKD